MTVEILQKDVGVWDADVQVFAGPGSRSQGVMTSRMTCGGTWLVSDYVSTSGSDFSGHGMWTFDKAKQKFVGVWADNTMTFLAPGEGTWDASSKTMTFLYEATIGDKPMKWRQTTESVDDDTQVFRSFVPHDAPTEVMRVTYKRRPITG